jgi:phytoene synthase
VSERIAQAELDACRSLLKNGSKSFYAASLSLPARVRVPATVVYAFCRILDDEVDEEGASPSVVDALRARLADAYAGRPHAHPVDRAFSIVVRDRDLPKIVFDALLEGFEWDLAGRRYTTIDALLDYCVRVAGTVGVAMSLLMGRREPQVLARACDLGIAMQLTNIARDVGHDARQGRVYLPLEWLEEAKVDVDALLAHPEASAGLRDVVRRTLDLADAYYLRADPGIGALPLDCRPAIRAARRIYAAIGREVRAQDHDSVTRRASVPTPDKLRLLLRSLAPSRSELRSLAQPETPGARFLVEGASR